MRAKVTVSTKESLTALSSVDQKGRTKINFLSPLIHGIYSLLPSSPTSGTQIQDLLVNSAQSCLPQVHQRYFWWHPALDSENSCMQSPNIQTAYAWSSIWLLALAFQLLWMQCRMQGSRDLADDPACIHPDGEKWHAANLTYDGHLQTLFPYVWDIDWHLFTLYNANKRQSQSAAS